MGAGNNKTIAVSVAGSICVIIAWALKEKFHVDIPPDVSAAAQGLLSIAVVYLVPHSSAAGATN